MLVIVFQSHKKKQVSLFSEPFGTFWIPLSYCIKAKENVLLKKKIRPLIYFTTMSRLSLQRGDGR